MCEMSPPEGQSPVFTTGLTRTILQKFYFEGAVRSASLAPPFLRKKICEVILIGGEVAELLSDRIRFRWFWS